MNQAAEKRDNVENDGDREDAHNRVKGAALRQNGRRAEVQQQADQPHHKEERVQIEQRLPIVRHLVIHAGLKLREFDRVLKVADLVRLAVGQHQVPKVRPRKVVEQNNVTASRRESRQHAGQRYLLATVKFVFVRTAIGAGWAAVYLRKMLCVEKKSQKTKPKTAKASQSQKRIDQTPCVHAHRAHFRVCATTFSYRHVARH